MSEIHDFLRDCYDSTSVKCNFICAINDWNLTPNIKNIVSQIHPETMKRYYGCGLNTPEGIEGKRVLDIGCGSGSLVFLLSKLVGPTGSVVGVDLSPNLIAECVNREDYHRNRWGYDKKNTEFFVGNAENMSQLKDQSFDVIVSNGVFCLIPDKSKSFAEAFRLMKDGGELYLNDIYAETPAPAELRDDLKFWDWAVTGSQLPDELLSSAKDVGFTLPYLTSVGPIDVNDSFKTLLPGRRYLCAGNRMFRLGSGSDRGPASVTYKGNIKDHESEFKWDVNLTFKTGEAVTVDGELAAILANTRYRDSFDLQDTSGPAETRRCQNPFAHLDQLSSQGKRPPCIFTVGVYL
ncbi:arsenite methyltransferase-like [Haliotis rufescens]|uniref:arsenite methyltransferase-like n=1 Tax=Haliotis rufescens TaxID=6454 RepID=UPI00201ED8AB|nr:arsenite methyltransferase-like [Haliotis rufescens]